MFQRYVEMGFDEQGAHEAVNRFGDDLHAGCHWLMMKDQMGSVPKRLKISHQQEGSTYIGSLIRMDGHRYKVDKFDSKHALIRISQENIDRVRWEHISDGRIEWLSVCHNSLTVKNPVTSWRRKIATVKFAIANIAEEHRNKLTIQNAMQLVIYHGNPSGNINTPSNDWSLWRSIVCLTHEHRHEPSGQRPRSRDSSSISSYRLQLMSYLHAISDVYGISPDKFNDILFNKGEDEVVRTFPSEMTQVIRQTLQTWEHPEQKLLKKSREWSRKCLPLVLFECERIDAENIHISVIFHDMTFVHPPKSNGHVNKQLQRLFFHIFPKTIPSLYISGPMDDNFCTHALRSSRKTGKYLTEPSTGIFVSELMPYQSKCLGWLISKENSGAANGTLGWTKHTVEQDGFAYWTSGFGQLSLTAPNTTVRGGLLAQEVGMGKTVELLALIATNKAPGPTLVVVPTTMLAVWISEAQKHVPSLKVIKFHGARRPKDKWVLEDSDIVLTTYKIVVSETNGHIPTLGAVRWGRIILDESHEMRTINTATTKAICKLYAPYRWCCSATPWPKAIDSVISMLAFLGVSPFDDAPSQGHFSTAAIALASQHELTPSLVHDCITKMTFWQKKRHVRMSLTKIHEREIECQNTWPELYKHLIDMISKRIQDDTDSNITRKTRLLHYRRWLRQAATHPILNKLSHYGMVSHNQVFTSETGVDDFLNHLGDTSYDQSLRDIIDSWKRGEERCSICMDAMDRPTLTPCHHMFCYECIQSAYQHDPSKKCPLCRAPAERNLEELVVDEKVQQVKEVLYLNDLQGQTVELSKDIHDNILDSKGKLGGKFQKVIDMLTKNTEKFIIFTQFHSTMMHLCHILEQHRFKYASISGSLSPGKRFKEIQEFQNNSDVKAFVMTTRTASVGITLTAASQIIFMEPIDSKSVKIQAIGRAWRIGQVKPVTVTTLKTRGTIDTSNHKDVIQYIQTV